VRSLALGLLALVLTGLAGPGSAEMVRPPWLQAVGQASAYVLVEDTARLPLQVEYGPGQNYGFRARTESLEQASVETQVHNVRLTGLLPATVYHYRVRDFDGLSAGYSFETAPASAGLVRFSWAADSRGNPNVFNRIAGLIAEGQPDLVLHGGDVVDSNLYRNWDRELFVPEWSRLISRVPFYLAPGNHEGWNSQARAFIQAPDSASGRQDYYSFDYGPVHFLVLNTELDLGPGSAQYRFAASDLETSEQAWKIVVAHKPAWSSGHHGSNAQMRRLSDEVCEPNGVSLVIAGHNHFYQHCFVNGIHHLTMGSAGADLHDPIQAWYVRKSARSYHCGLFEARPHRLSLVISDDYGRPMDRVELTR